MIRREGLGFNASCDHCSHDEDFYDADSFQCVVDEMKAQGWRIKKEPGGWDHTCPDCLEKEIEDLR